MVAAEWDHYLVGTIRSNLLLTISEKGALSAVFSRDDFCAQAGCKYSAGWVKDSKVSKIEVISPQGETVTARMKNGFWWAGPYDWGRDFSKSRVVAYNKAGEVLHDVDLMSLWSL